MKYVFQCSDVYDEAARIANRICGLVSCGVRYSDIAVAVCDYDDTVAVYNEIFAECQIPVNIDVGMKLIDHPLVKYLRDYILGNPWKEKEPPKTEEFVKNEIIKILETVKNILGDQVLSDQEFCNMFCTLAAAVKISNVPVYADRVLIVAAKEYEPSFVPYLFVAGAAEGVFPAAVADTDIITEQDIKSMSIRIEPTAGVQNKRAQIHAQNILASAVKELYISYSAANINGERMRPSGIIEEFGCKEYKEDLASRVYASRRVLAAIGSGEAFKDGKAGYWMSVKNAADLGDFAVPRISAVSDNIKCGEELFFSGNKASITQIENFYKCPFYHFLVNGLRLKKRDFNKTAPNILGTILHKIAEELIKNGGKIEEIVTNVLKEYELPNYTVRAINKQARLMERFLISDIEKSEFKPKFFEHKIEQQIDGVNVRGTADRVDTAVIDGQEYARVIDYKSGSNVGPKLQIPLYMGFLCGEFVPAESFYLNLKTFKKTNVTPDEIEPSFEMLQSAVKDIKHGVIAPTAVYPKVCEYCPAGGWCTRRK